MVKRVTKIHIGIVVTKVTMVTRITTMAIGKLVTEVTIKTTSKW
jgi:hypothetical protein